ncbi:NADPH-dependent FMN reductase [Pusillimonas sp. SM2304]|uniref:NADPH-dependent FMN reductase n=1 Tax=Pusillimonas sp. SM2304 TaxID=3073241 RepID=UPI0028756CB6|nr:NADPH-dependent FMN reductase [Pusillimonas sp. SM2304]MDS1139478.1 NADPH-dependent FMN reductase [Pusillimonas sp. SM2304]
MTKLVGIAGSLRRHSYNRGLLKAAVESMPSGATLEVAEIDEIPLYNADLEESDGIPHAVNRIKDAIAVADGLLLVTPEYNNGIPGVFKNVIDWLSRPPTDIPRVFHGKPVALIGVSPGGFGTVLAQNSWLSVLHTLGTRPWFEGRLLVSRAGSMFDSEGNLTDKDTRERLSGFLDGFATFVRAGAAARRGGQNMGS